MSDDRSPVLLPDNDKAAVINFDGEKRRSEFDQVAYLEIAGEGNEGRDRK